MSIQLNPLESRTSAELRELLKGGVRIKTVDLICIAKLAIQDEIDTRVNEADNLNYPNIDTGEPDEDADGEICNPEEIVI